MLTHGIPIPTMNGLDRTMSTVTLYLSVCCLESLDLRQMQAMMDTHIPTAERMKKTGAILETMKGKDTVYTNNSSNIIFWYR